MRRGAEVFWLGHYAPSMETSANDWSFECQPAGRDGFLFYHEGSRQIPFYWAYGGGDVLVILRILEPDKFNLRYPWALLVGGRFLNAWQRSLYVGGLLVQPKSMTRIFAFM